MTLRSSQTRITREAVGSALNSRLQPGYCEGCHFTPLYDEHMRNEWCDRVCGEDPESQDCQDCGERGVDD